MSDNRLRIWFVLFVLAVFCVGLAGGVLVGRRLFPAPGLFFGFRGDPPAFGGRMGGPPPQYLVEQMARELDLTPEQRTQVEGVLKASRGRVEEFQRDVRDRFENERRTLRDEIRKVLTPEQQQQFERWLERQPRGRNPGRRGGI